MRPGKVSLRLMLYQIVSLLLSDNEFISSRKEIYFFPYRNLFPCGRKFISFRMPQNFFPYSHKFSTVYKFILVR
jgi:hypothetical protein